MRSNAPQVSCGATVYVVLHGSGYARGEREHRRENSEAGSADPGRRRRPVAARVAAHDVRAGRGLVEEAASVEEAVAAIARTRPDVIVLDVGLPGVDGVTFASELNASDETREIGIVLLTGGDLRSRPDVTPARPPSSASPSARSTCSQPSSAHRARRRHRCSPRRPRRRSRDQLLLYAGDVRRLLEVERRQRRNIERSYRETLGALANALESRDVGTGEHSARVQRYARELTSVSRRSCSPIRPSSSATSSTTSARSASPTGSSASRDRSTPTSGASWRRTRRSARRSSPASGCSRSADRDRPPPPRALGRQRLPGPARRANGSRSRRASSRSPTRSTR